MDDPERERWQRLYRALRNIVVQMQRPGDRYTLSIRLVPKERTEQTTR